MSNQSLFQLACQYLYLSTLEEPTTAQLNTLATLLFLSLYDEELTRWLRVTDEVIYNRLGIQS